MTAHPANGMAPPAIVADPASRVGIYDSRAVAIAWVRSEGFRAEMGALTAERAAAKKAGDTAKVRALDARGAALQQQVHRQGFGTDPVDDILERVAGELPALRAREGVDMLMSRFDPSLAEPRGKDVTDALVALFHPDEETLRHAREIRAMQPMAMPAEGSSAKR